MVFPKIVGTLSIAAAFYTSSIDGFAGKLSLGRKPFATNNNALSHSRLISNSPLLKATENDDEGMDVSDNNDMDQPPEGISSSSNNPTWTTPRDARILKPLQFAAATSSSSCGCAEKSSSGNTADVMIFFPPAAVAAATVAAPSKLASFDAAVKINFPTALSTSETSKRLTGTLKKNNFTPETTLFGSSICSDEVNTARSGSIHETLKREYFGDQAFHLGGLAGLPFAGVSGMGAFVSHCGNRDTKENKLFIFLASHVGVSEDGRVGRLVRKNMGNASGACGAAIGAYKKLMADQELMEKEMEKQRLELERVKEQGEASVIVSTTTATTATAAPTPKEDVDSVLDGQEDYIVRQLKPRLQPLLEQSLTTAKVDHMTFVAYQTYSVAREMLKAEMGILSKKQAPFLSKKGDKPYSIAILAGIVINRGTGGAAPNGGKGVEDYFQPLLFQSADAHDSGTTSVTDLFSETFGKAPNLNCILGSKDIASEVLKPDLLTKSIV